MKNKSPTKVSLSELIVDEAFQPRFQMSRDAIRRYAAAYRANPRELPPITVAEIKGRLGLYLIDGFHRVQAAKIAHLSHLPAHALQTDKVGAMWLAVEANMRHGVPISRREKRVIFRRFVDAGRNRKEDGSLMSSRELNQHLHLGSHQTMLAWMQADFPTLYAEMAGRDPEEIVENELTDTSEEDALANVSWAVEQLCRSVQRASEVASKPAIASELHDVIAKLEDALGEQSGGLEKRAQEYEDSFSGDF